MTILTMIRSKLYTELQLALALKHYCHPLYAFVLFFMLGIICHDIFWTLSFYWGVSIAVFIFFMPLQYRSIIFVCTSAFSVGSALYTYQEFAFTCAAKRYAATKSITAVVIDTNYTPSKKFPFVLRIRDCATSNTLELHLRHYTAIQVADTILLCNTIFTPSTGSYRKICVRNNIVATAFCTKLHYHLIKRPLYSVQRSVHMLRNNTLTKIRNKMTSATHNLFSSIFLGVPLPQSNLLRTHFIYWGIVHYLARSGLHLVLFLLMWRMIMQTLPIPWLMRHIAMTFFILLYLLLSWTSVSFNRACSLFFLSQICNILSVRIHQGYLLALTTFLILTYNPSHIFFLDFQLSFGLTAALAITSAIRRYKTRIVA